LATEYTRKHFSKGGSKIGLKFSVLAYSIYIQQLSIINMPEYQQKSRFI